MDKNAIFNLDDLNVDVPMTRAKFEEVTAAMNSERSKPTSEFLAVKRTNKLLKHAYLQSKDGADVGKYRPREEFLQTKITGNLTINPEQRTFGKKPIYIPPECVADKT